jgi:hypothetical protein
MKKLINLLFDRIERVLWFRYMIWVLKRNDNSAYYYPIEYDETTKKNVQRDRMITCLMKILIG